MPRLGIPTFAQEEGEHTGLVDMASFGAAGSAVIGEATELFRRCSGSGSLFDANRAVHSLRTGSPRSPRAHVGWRRQRAWLCTRVANT